MPSEFLVVAEQVLERARRPMSAKEIVSFGMEQGMFSNNIAGRTPHQTMKAKLSVNIRRFGNSSRFVRMAPGRFYLRALVTDASDVYHAPAYRKPASNERILVIPAPLFGQVVQFQGLNENWKAVRQRLLRSDKCK